MDRTLQSALEKRTRVGAWSSRVYRLERGYLSTWSDARLAAKEQPSRTECLFQDKQVAVLTDQGGAGGLVNLRGLFFFNACCGLVCFGRVYTE